MSSVYLQIENNTWLIQPKLIHFYDTMMSNDAVLLKFDLSFVKCLEDEKVTPEYFYDKIKHKRTDDGFISIQIITKDKEFLTQIRAKYIIFNNKEFRITKSCLGTHHYGDQVSDNVDECLLEMTLNDIGI